MSKRFNDTKALQRQPVPMVPMTASLMLPINGADEAVQRVQRPRANTSPDLKGGLKEAFKVAKGED